MGAFHDVMVLFFLLGSLRHCSTKQSMKGKHDDQGLEKILKAVLVHESTGHGLHSGRVSSHSVELNIQTDPSFHSQHIPSYGSANSNSGYLHMHKPQLANKSNGKGYNYESPNTFAVNNDESHPNADYQHNKPNKGGYQYENPVPQETQSSGHGYSKTNNPEFRGTDQSWNTGYSYNVPSKSFEEGFQTHPDIKNVYVNDKPVDSYRPQSNFKGHSYLPDSSLDQSGYKYKSPVMTEPIFQNQLLPTHPVTGDFSSGYWYAIPAESRFKENRTHENKQLIQNHGYTYPRPNQSSEVFRGQPYLPEPRSEVFRGQPYLPVTKREVFAGQPYLPQRSSEVFRGQPNSPKPKS